MLLYDLDLPTLANLIQQWNEPSYRAKQIWQGLYQHFYDAPEQFTNLPKPLREKLSQNLNFSPLVPKSRLDSSDGRTRKTLFELQDKNLIETVLMKYEREDGRDETRKGLTNSQSPITNYQLPTTNPQSPITNHPKTRHTLCISTQSGCAMDCAFCATGQMGFKRHLSSGEIVAQVMYYARMLNKKNETLANIVFMGMGEPFHNYDNVMASIDRLNDADGFNFGARRFTVSTVGLVPQIKRFANEQRQVNLAISLHAADDETRRNMMPVNKQYKIDEVLDACKYYVEKTRRRVTFEWALIHGINDTPETARRLAEKLFSRFERDQRGLLHVNAIPLNPTKEYKGAATSRERAAQFKETLEQNGIACTVRMRRGVDIHAGCGQLAGAQ